MIKMASSEENEDVQSSAESSANSEVEVKKAYI